MKTKMLMPVVALSLMLGACSGGGPGEEEVRQIIKQNYEQELARTKQNLVGFMDDPEDRRRMLEINGLPQGNEVVIQDLEIRSDEQLESGDRELLVNMTVVVDDWTERSGLKLLMREQDNGEWRAIRANKVISVGQ
ncbi:MAG: hypothetical protein RJQ08_11080 [Salinisphaeraceae bacterium]